MSLLTVKNLSQTFIDKTLYEEIVWAMAWRSRYDRRSWNNKYIN